MRAAAFEVEVQKRLALAAACMVLALAGASILTRFPRGDVGLLIGGSTLVFAGYYAALVAGESLADRQVIAPGVAMWMANALLLGVALVLAWRPSRATRFWTRRSDDRRPGSGLTRNRCCRGRLVWSRITRLAPRDPEQAL